ncbi:MAG: S-adenosyl-methyltransferase MraW [actinobacterium acAMD-5]|nr:MAG: S-adenosyl-methyltransferase MraW [actinobacterium acAMD-5]
MIDGAAPIHLPVMMDRIVGLFAPAVSNEGAVLVDATLGLGGHTAALMSAYPQLRIVGIDRDQSAIEIASKNLSAQFGSEAVTARVQFVHAVYDRIGEVLAEIGYQKVDGVLLDLGVSSMQLDQASRGFAYSKEAPLDMRMDSSTGQTAAQVLNESSADELKRILYTFGEEKFASRIANAIVAKREIKPFSTTSEVVELLYSVIPAPARRTGGHPAKRTFQALRIAVNQELEILQRAIPAAIESLNVNGRIAVLSYHSLEDRIVKQSFIRAMGSRIPDGLPIMPGPDNLVLLTRGAETPTDLEIAENPRAASAKLRAAQVLSAGVAA